MVEYKLEVSTGDMPYAGTWDHISVTLIGTEGQSDRTELDQWGRDFSTGAKRTYSIKSGSSLGRLLLLKVDKDPYLLFPEDEWYCSKIQVGTPEGKVLLFPCHRWISRGELVELRAAKATKVFEEDQPVLKDHRDRELTEKKKQYQWKLYQEGLPYIGPFDEEADIPTEMQRSDSRKSEVNHIKMLLGIELKLKALLGSDQRWQNFEDLKRIFWFERTALSDYVAEHWKEDDIYGAQFLNGVNPNVIKRCSELPRNFPVTNEMVKSFLAQGSSLQHEMKKGNVFLYDQKKMDGIPPRTYNGAPLHITPGLCLFYMNSENKLKPIAIQLYQKPSENNPIFLPSDSETDWLLAKMFIKNADAMDHQAVYHFMNTHLLVEVFLIATLRNLPTVHPIYKLLIPHFRYTLPLNISARKILFGPKGPFKTSSLGIDGMMELMRRSLSELTYSALCLPDNIIARGLETVPNFYYRDDGLKLWDIISSFVKAMVEHYYLSDGEVQKDCELQDWIKDIFTYGLLGNRASGFPESFSTVEALVKFITVVIFTASGQHGAVNSGQFDYLFWIPNASLLLVTPSPSAKGQSTQQTVLDALPTVGDTVKIAALIRLLSSKFTDMVPLGSYPEEQFDEPASTQMMKKFQAELSYLSEAITERNSRLHVPYTYLNPLGLENSITV